MKVNKIKLVMAGLLFPAVLLAQTDGDQDELNAEIAVVKPYNPSISDAFKINKQPSAADSISQKLPVRYQITTKPLDISFKLSPIKPPRIARTPVDKLYNNSVRIGFGNSGTFLVEGLLNSQRSREGAYGVRLHHLSSKANVPDVDESGYATTGLEVYGKKFFTRYALTGELGAYRDVVRYYGMASDYNGVSGPKQQFLGLNGNVTLQANRSKDQVFFDKAGLGYSFLKGDFGMNEQIITSLLEVSKSSKEGIVLAQLESEFLTNTKELASGTKEQQYFKADIGMQIEAHKEKFNYRAGLKVASLLDISNSATKVFFYPNIHVSYNLLQDYIIAYAGANGGLTSNNMHYFSKDNPFVNTLDSINYRNDKIGILGGLKGRISAGANYHLGVHYSKVENYAFYQLADTAVTPLDQERKFDLLYDDVNRFQFFGELGIALSKKLLLSSRMDLLAFTMSDLLKPYYQPNLRASVSARYNIQEKIFLDSEWYYTGARFFNNTQKIDGFVDGNLGIEYQYSKNLSAFVQANNLLGNNYGLWEGYLSQGFNILGGFNYKF